MYHGLGGLHASLNPGIYEEDSEYEIRDIDATLKWRWVNSVN
jgi:hypothetical protein